MNEKKIGKDNSPLEKLIPRIHVWSGPQAMFRKQGDGAGGPL